jgi:hypothetical protein
MYSIVLTIHSWMRWLTLVLATAATLNATRRPLEGVAALPGRWWDTFLMLAVDLQVFFGLVLYFGLSPFTRKPGNVSLAMASPALRFWAVEHAGGMFLSVVLVRMGRVSRPMPKHRPPRGNGDYLLRDRDARMLISIPWPGLANGRPLFGL